MKRLIIIVEGHTEDEFVREVLRPFFAGHGFYDVRPIKIATSKIKKGGFVNFAHLKNDAVEYLREPDTVVTMFVDFFRIPTSVPDYNTCLERNTLVDSKIACLEAAIGLELGHPDFIPYVQKNEFEALLFAANTGFENLFKDSIFQKTATIIEAYPNPEDINSGPNTSPSKRLESIFGKEEYDKVTYGSMVALEVGIEAILEKCPRFRNWIETLLAALKPQP